MIPKRLVPQGNIFCECGETFQMFEIISSPDLLYVPGTPRVGQRPNSGTRRKRSIPRNPWRRPESRPIAKPKTELRAGPPPHARRPEANPFPWFQCQKRWGSWRELCNTAVPLEETLQHSLGNRYCLEIPYKASHRDQPLDPGILSKPRQPPRWLRAWLAAGSAPPLC